MFYDADANVVKVVVQEVGDVSFGIRQCVAFITEGLAVEELPAAPGSIIDGVLITRDKVIKRGIERDKRSFIGGDSTQQIAAVHWPAEDFLKGLLVRVDAGDRGYRSLQAGVPHLDRIDDR